MAVIINEFEVEAAQEPASAPPQASTQKEAPKPDAREIEKILRCRMERMVRIWAH